MRNFLLIVVLILVFWGCKEEAGYGIFEGKPRVNPPYVTGNYPATEFIFAIPTSGERPIRWKAEGLPGGLKLNPETGIIRGVVEKPGEYQVQITVSNVKGTAKSKLTLKIGDELALTPVMGWNSWNTFGGKLTEALVIETAEAMIANGMRDLGYQYVNIDDFWQLADRDVNGHMIIDSVKFPRGIKYVADYLHERGLKLGIYSDAARYTCGGVCGSYGFEQIDAQDFASWGVDLLKYDYCGAPVERDTAVLRYRLMGEALRSTDRSVIYSVCEWGQREPWTWAKEVGGHYWRTTWDIRDAWDMGQYDAGHNGVLPIYNITKELDRYAGPGGWNDPDMLIVGMFGHSHSINSGDRKYGCTLEEYRSHMSLWCMMASPLLSGNDVRNMADSVKNILLNPEVIAINQDMLGKQARVVKQTEEIDVLVKPLAEGYAVAVFNRGETEETMKLDFAEIGVEAGKVRDVWKHTNMGKKEGLELTLKPHVCEVFVVK